MGIKNGNPRGKRPMRRSREPLAVTVTVTREAGRWVHAVEELNLWPAEKEFDLSREYFAISRGISLWSTRIYGPGRRRPRRWR